MKNDWRCPHTGSCPDPLECRSNEVAALMSRNTSMGQALQDILIRCEEGDKRSDWLPVIARLAREGLENATSEVRK